MYNCLHTIPACDRRTDGQTSCHGIVKTMTGLPYTEENMWHIKPFQQYAAWHTDRRTEFPHQYHASALLCWHTIKIWLLICMKHKPEVNTVCLFTFETHLPSNQQTCAQTEARPTTKASPHWVQLQTSSAQCKPGTWGRLAPSSAQFQPASSVTWLKVKALIGHLTAYRSM